MCLAIPSKVVSIDKNSNSVIVDTLGVRRECSLDLMQESLSVGEYVLLHVGYVIGKIDLEDALESLKLFQTMIKNMEEDS